MISYINNSYFWTKLCSVIFLSHTTTTAPPPEINSWKLSVLVVEKKQCNPIKQLKRWTKETRTTRNDRFRDLLTPCAWVKTGYVPQCQKPAQIKAGCTVWPLVEAFSYVSVNSEITFFTRTVHCMLYICIFHSWSMISVQSQTKYVNSVRNSKQVMWHKQKWLGVK